MGYQEKIAAAAPPPAAPPADGPDPVDIAVGKRLRALRRLRGLTQDRLARAAGVRFQQVQKYETGANRISASRLVRFANALDLPVSTFFDEAGSEHVSALSPDELALIRAWRATPDIQRTAILSLARALAREDAE